jgi:hypothetical protein
LGLFCGRRTEAETFDLFLEVVRRQVSIDLGREARILVAHDSLHGSQVGAAHQQQRGRTIPPPHSRAEDPVIIGWTGTAHDRPLSCSGAASVEHVRLANWEASQDHMSSFAEVYAVEKGPGVGRRRLESPAPAGEDLVEDSLIVGFVHENLPSGDGVRAWRSL